jgi:hypothetical protein
MSTTLLNDASLRLLRLANGRPPYLSGERDDVIRPSATEAEEVRLAQQELDRWQDAFDQNCHGDDPDRYHSEIRFAERRLRLAISSANCGTETVPSLPTINR